MRVKVIPNLKIDRLSQLEDECLTKVWSTF